MAKPSSSTSRTEATASAGARTEVAPVSDAAAAGGGLFGFLARGYVPAEVSDAAWLRAMLDVEAAIARAEARAGVIPQEAAGEIAAACRAARFDADLLGREAAATGNPVPPLVAALTAAVGGEAARYVHLGATSQDVMDTAAMLVVRRAATPLLADLSAAADAAAGLAAAHRTTLTIGRTLLQQAQPTTFGAVAAGWLSGLDRAFDRLRDALDASSAVQFGGAVGTLASLGDRGEIVLRYLAEDLGLGEPDVPWHTERSRIFEIASALGEAAGAAGKVALDVALLAQTEIGEVREGAPGRGGSSTLPQKRNPVAAVTARACAARAPGLVATILSAMPQELQRGAGTWQAEWQTLSDLLVATGSAVAWLRDCLEHLEVDSRRMRANLDGGAGLALAERVATSLAPTLGRLAAHRLVEEAVAETLASGRAFAGVLAGRPEIAARLDGDAIADLLDPTGYLGSAPAFVDRALAAHAARGPGR